ncbi:MAG: FGGY family carbohydrate kinase, partial [Atribacterota bacterium]
MTPGKGVLVLDIGTESVRAAIVDQNGSIVALRAKNTDFFSPFAGWAEQKPEEWWSLSGDCIRAITSQYPDF